MPKTANERYFDAAIRHQIGIRRLSSGEVNRLMQMILERDREFAALLRVDLARLVGKKIDFKSPAFKKLIGKIAGRRAELQTTFRAELRKLLVDLARSEVEFENAMLSGSMPVQLELTSPGTGAAPELVATAAFAVGTNQARTFDQWTKQIKRDDAARVVEAIQLGLAQGEGVQRIVQRVAGTRAGGFRDGVLSINRRHAETIIRTTINNISNQARETVWDANEDIIGVLRWTSTLDGRTSAICRSRDGKYTAIGSRQVPEGLPRLDPPEARPPAHPNCRSVMVAILDAGLIAEQMSSRPFVRDARTRRFRERDFRKEARQQDIPVRELRQRWADQNVGRVPAETTYSQWLKKQPAKFQDEVLGKEKARLFREGKVTLDQFVDRRGNELTLAQLRETIPALLED